MKVSHLVAAATLLALSISASWAQTGPGGGPGSGPRMQGAGPGASAPGMGMHRGTGPMGRWGADTTPGWSMMTPAERTEHQERMRSAKTYEECKTVMEQHREQMAARAKEKGGKALRTPRRDACAGLKP